MSIPEAAFAPFRPIVVGLVALIGAACTTASPSSTPESPPSIPITPPVEMGDAFVTSDPKADTWTIGNNGIQATFGFTSAKDFVLLEIASSQTGRPLTSVSAPDTVVTVNGNSAALGSAASGWTLDSASTSQPNGGVQLAFVFRSSSLPLTIERSYACYPGSPTIEAWTTFQATGSGSVTVSNPNVWQLVVPGATVHYLSGLRGDSAAIDIETAFAIQTTTLNSGGQFNRGAQRRSTEQFVPAVFTDSSDLEFYGGLLWSGSWQITLENDAGQLNIAAGLPNMDITVDAQHPLEAPHGIFGIAPAGLGNVSQALRGFIDLALRQRRAFSPLVTYNTWFSYGTAIDEPSMHDEMLAAANMGVELFVMDAGWYPGTGVNGVGDFTSGLGNLTADPARFPSGLPALSTYAHNLGLKFGLWVEPERTDLMYVGRPGFSQEAWLATTNGTYDGNNPSQQPAPLICLGSAAAQSWLLNQLTTLLDQVQPDYVKWDNNFWINCSRSGHGHGATDGNRAHVQGLYSLLSTLRSRYPGIVFENCSGGGNRLDLGMLRYTDTAWMDDRTVPSVHVRHNLEGLTTIFPPAYLLSFVNDDAAEPIANAQDLQLYMRSRMPGILGLNYRSANLGDADRAGLSQEIAVYQSLRDTVRDASGLLLTAQASSTNGPPWDAIQELASATGTVILFGYQNDPGVSRVLLQPTGLDPGTTYAVTTADGVPIVSASGSDLMANGVEIDTSPVSAAHVLLLQPQPAASRAAAKPGRKRR